MGPARRSKAARSARWRLVRSLGLAVGVLTLAPAIALAHPLGNFTINHYAHVRIEPDRVVLDVVMDQAEIPTFQERQTLDTDLDGSVSDEEIVAGRVVSCERMAVGLRLTTDGRALELRTIRAGLDFPAGVGGLSTLRLVCGYEAALPAPVGATPVRIAFADETFAGRIGWREIVTTGSGVTLTPVSGEVRAVTESGRLTVYPESMLATPLADEGVTVDVVAGGAVLAPLAIEGASSVSGMSGSGAPAAGGPVADSPVGHPAEATIDAGPVAAPRSEPAPAVAAAIPGGIGGELPAIFRATDLTPLAVLLSVVAAAGLGAAHALTPGHGKTLMAAYLVGTRGTPVHAVGLGLAVSVSHTLGIVALAAVAVGAADALPPDLLVRVAPIVAAVSIVAVGAWMVAGEIQRRWAAATSDGSGHEHDEGTERGDGRQHRHGHEHEHEHEHDAAGLRPDADGHRHARGRGISSHMHLPPAGSTITWRGLFALGLAGGLIPSTSALLMLLGAIAAGRPTFGFVLVAAFGLGMAAVMVAIGLALVVARDRLDRFPTAGGFRRVRAAMPLAASILVFGFGIVLTAQALGSPPAL